MSGIAGIVSSNASGTVDPDLASWLASAAGSTAGAHVLTWEHGGFAVHAAPGCRATLTSREVGGAVVRLAFHGITFEPEGTDPARAPERLLDAYLERGLSFLTGLRGDFSLAIWDGRDRSTHLAVDCFRVQTIYHHADSRGLVFGTRLAALESCPRFSDRALDPRAVLDLVEISRIQTPHTIYRSVQKLPEGTSLSYRDGHVRLDRYWRPDYRREDGRPLAELERDVRERFQDAVRARLVQDGAGKVGAYLSGGVDSTAVLGTLTKLTGSRVPAFSIAFDEPGFNELGFAETAARSFHADHHVHFVTPRETIDLIPALVAMFDEPFANASAVPAYYCARLAHGTGVQVLYAGDGGDEIFAGNDAYAMRRVFEYYDRIPPPLRSLVVGPAATLAGSVLPWGPFRKARAYVRRASVTYPERLGAYDLYRAFSKERLFQREFLDLAGNGYVPFRAQAARYREALATAELDRQLYLDLRLLIADSDLIKVTRTAERAGIGVRFPFLDRPLADFAAAVPASIKMRGRRLRSFFKDAFADLLPEETRAKKKHGFGLPIAVWMRKHAELRDLVRELVLGERTMARGVFLRAGVEELFRLHEAEEGTSYYGPAVWNVVMLECWLRAREDVTRASLSFGRARADTVTA
ncbi:MAG TPA: asparagine synthase C-terminal domain-containing protein [Candidatus Eisenbacteria bacterium]|nr:asparagine synthase C-terminal domain-containing protein [Candidatus Eisenbacteria bacterium]